MEKFKSPGSARKSQTKKEAFSKRDSNETMRGPEEKATIYRLNLLGARICIKRYPYDTWCFWTKIRFLKEGEEFYSISLDSRYKTVHGESIDLGIRREYFFNKQFRQYKGNQFCFVEFAEFWHTHKRFPNNEELVKFGLDKRLADKYKRLAGRIAAT